AIGIAHDEIARAPGLLLERLVERHARVLELKEELADFRGAVDGDRSGQQALALADIADEHRLADHPEVEPRGVTLDLAVERRLAIGEDDAETKLAGEEVARGLDVDHEQLSFELGQFRRRRFRFGGLRRRLQARSQRLPALEAGLTSDQL